MSNESGILAGRTMLVTGGGRGIGRALALAFARHGADVCVAARTQEQVEAVAGEIQQLGRRALAVQADVTKREPAEALAARVRAEFGALHILVNNAGGGGEMGTVMESDPEAWVRVFNANALSVYQVSRALLPLIIESGGGHVLNIGSGMGHGADAGSSCYRASKAAAWTITRCMAMELWDKGVLVNELIPGPVQAGEPRPGWTAGQAPAFASNEYVKRPEEVAPLALWIVSQGPHGPTGQSFSLARRPL